MEDAEIPQHETRRQNSEGNNMDTEDICTLKVAAAVLKVSIGTAYRMAERGELPGAAKVSGQWRVNRTAMLAGLGLGLGLAS